MSRTNTEAGYTLLENGEIFVDLRVQSIGLNRFRFISNKCATAFMDFSKKEFGNSYESIAEAIFRKINALRFGSVFIKHENGISLFIFDWLLKSGRDLTLRGLGNFNFLIEVKPLPGDFLKEWVIKFGLLTSSEYIVFANPADDYKRINTGVRKSVERGKEEAIVPSHQSLNSRIYSEKEMFASLLDMPEKKIKSISCYHTENIFRWLYSPLTAVPCYMQREIESPITLPNGEERSIAELL